MARNQGESNQNLRGIKAIYENCVLRPLEAVDLHDGVEVTISVDDAQMDQGNRSERQDPLAGLRCNTGINNLAERFSNNYTDPELL